MKTDAQVRLLRQKMTEGKTQEAAAASADMSERSARRWQQGPLPSEKKKTRAWRTRPDPLAAVWDSEVVPLLRSDEDGVLEGPTLLDELERRHPGQYGPKLLRTMQRRVRDWRAMHGPNKEVFFEQVHPPGREASIDFTHCTELGVTIRGEVLVHLIFEFVLSCSGWTWVTLAFAETFEALLAGIQGALWALGGAPAVARTDNLSAATHELRESRGRALTKRFKQLLDHYGMRSTRITPGESHENGVVEKAHDLLKSALEQALVIRGSKDFDSVEDYLGFVREIVDRKRNRGIEATLAEERKLLRPLPSTAIPSYTTFRPKVRRWSTIHFAHRIYSVPSRLMGHVVEVRQHADVVEVLFRDKVVETMPRLRGKKDHRIDYRHVIWSLVRKPGAFARYRYREELFPSLAFRRAYDALRSNRGERADIEYVRILHLAASTMESTVERALAGLLERGEPLDYAAVKALASPGKPSVPLIAIGPPNLAAYDTLLSLPAGGAR